jgi:hypothetical protein
MTLTAPDEIMTNKHLKSSYNKSTPPKSESRLYFWLIIAALAAFIFLLFYSQKIQGLM